ncbi:MAG: hypothetical protein ACKPKO_49685, partial [Candidatus Fonsibacter sp.]
TKELQRQLHFQKKVSVLMQLWKARWASRTTLILQTMPSGNIKKHNEKRNDHLWTQRAGKDLELIRRSSRWTPAPRCSWRPWLGSSRWGMLFENASAGEWTIVCLRTYGFHVTPQSPVGKLVCVLA